VTAKLQFPVNLCSGKTPIYPRTWCWVDPRPGIDDVQKINTLALPGKKHRLLGSQVRNQSLERLKYFRFYVILYYVILLYYVFISEEPGWHSRYSDWLRTGKPRGRGSSPGRVKNILFSTSSKPALWSTQPPIQWVLRALSPRVKRPGREADHSPRVNAEVKKIWICKSTPPYDFMV
jgi:hypothetical protein